MKQKPRTRKRIRGKITTQKKLIFSHPDYTVGTGVTPVPLPAAGHGLMRHAQTPSVGNLYRCRKSLSEPRRHITLPRRFPITKNSICFLCAPVNGQQENPRRIFRPSGDSPLRKVFYEGYASVIILQFPCKPLLPPPDSWTPACCNTRPSFPGR